MFGDQKVLAAVNIQRIFRLQQTIITDEILKNTDRDDKQMKSAEIDQNLLHECQR